MASSQVSVYPINSISFVVDRSITNPFDVFNHLAAFQGQVKEVAVKGNQHGLAYVYFFAPDDQENATIQLFKYSIGSLEISIAYNVPAQQIILEIFLTIPILGTVLVGSVTGALQNGVEVRIGYDTILDGVVGVKTVTGADAYLYYEIKTFHQSNSGEVKIF